MSAYYPIMMDLRSALCVLIGGGKVAQRKIAALLEAGADVLVISPSVHPQIAEWNQHGRIRVNLRQYTGAGDLIGARLVFATTDTDEVNLAVCRDAKQLGIPVNDASVPDRGSFTVPASMRRGKLHLAVSTSGASPQLARMIRDELSDQYGLEYEQYVDLLAELRQLVMSRVLDAAIRNEIFQKAVRFDILEMIRAGQVDECRHRIWVMLDDKTDNRMGD